jgi:hypothetical protein
MKTKEIIYFDEPGAENTVDVIEAAKKRAQELNISHVVIASTKGDTALKAYEIFKEDNVSIVSVGEHSGFKGDRDNQLLPDEMRKELEDKGVKVLICSHVLSGVERSITKKFGGVSRVEIIAATLRQFGGEGIKVAVEISVMAADAGLIPTDREVIAIGGTGGGADSAIVLKAAHMNNYFDLEIREIIAKARQRK